MTARRHSDAALAVLLAVLMVAAILACFAPLAHGASIPPQAERYRRDLVRSARYVFGMDAPIAVLAAQVHQESAWRPDARSAYASGLAQFTPDTVRTMARMYPGELGASAPLDPRWALLALCRFDKQLYDRASYAATPADRWGFTFAGYNSGPGWPVRDRAKARALGLDPTRWFGHVETVNSGRAPQFHHETQVYARRILLSLQGIYLPWGPGVAVEGLP